MIPPPHLLAAALLVFGGMIVEARRAARNERSQRALGGIEPDGDVYAVMQVVYPGLFAVMLIEGAARGSSGSPALVAGFGLFGMAKLLKWWAILSLGPCWTFRVIVVPGAGRVRTGPYRFLNHPNYVAVIGEIVGIALVSGARVTGPLALIVFGALLTRRISVENRALGAILRRS